MKKDKRTIYIVADADGYLIIGSVAYDVRVSIQRCEAILCDSWSQLQVDGYRVVIAELANLRPHPTDF